MLVELAMNYLLQVENLSKRFGKLQAVDGISFGIPPGICFGLLGPNGAGKTTTIEMIEGVTPSDGGSILFDGAPRDGSFKQQAGIQFQQTSLMDNLRVIEVLELFAGLYHHSANINELCALCQLDPLLDRYANKLSGGQRQRLLLALALVNEPRIVFLDEPTTGLDPQARRGFWSLVNDIKQRGVTVVLTTHYMDEAEFLCDDLVIMDQGTIVDQGSPQQLLQKHLPQKCVVLAPQDEQALAGLHNASVQRQPHCLEIHTDSVEQTLQELLARGANLEGLAVHNPTLEDLFIRLTGHALRE